VRESGELYTIPPSINVIKHFNSLIWSVGCVEVAIPDRNVGFLVYLSDPILFS
jgi:hypothetical protein